MTPQVGLAAMVSDLGNSKLPWEQAPASKFAAVHANHMAEHEPRPYVVSRARAAQQLEIAFATTDERAKLRRLEQALESPALRYDDVMTPRMAKAANQAQVLSDRVRIEEKKKLLKTKMQEAQKAGIEVDKEKLQEEANKFEEEEKAAATRIQSLYRGKKDRKATESKLVEKREQERLDRERREEEHAATKIQSRFRGKAARSQMRG